MKIQKFEIFQYLKNKIYSKVREIIVIVQEKIEMPHIAYII